MHSTPPNTICLDRTNCPWHQELLDNAPIGIARTLPDGRPLHINAHMARMYGFTSAAQFIAHVHDMTTVYVNPLDRDRLCRRLALGPVDGFVVPHRRVDGSQFWVSISSRIARDEAGSELYYEGFFTDITATKNAEDSARILSEMFRNAENIVVFKDVHLRYVLINPAYERLTGHTSANIIGMTDRELFAELATPEEIHAYENHDRAALEMPPGCVVTVEESLTTNGQTRTYLTQKFPVYAENGRLLGVGCITQDITERKRSRLALMTSEKLYSSLSEDMPLLICKFSPDLSISYANDAYCRYFSSTADELRGESILRFIPEADREACLTHLAELTPAHPFRSFEHPVHLPYGGMRWQRWTDRAIFDEHNNIIGYQSIGEDITELRRLEQAKADVDHIMRHDLKSPLNAFINIPQLLLDDDNLTSEQRDMLSILTVSAKKMLSQINNTLVLQRIENGTYRLRPATCDPLALIRDTAQMLSMCAGSKQNRFQIESSDPRVAELRSDPVLLDTLLINLMRNALEASSPDAQVRVELIHSAQHLRITITNDLPVPPEMRDRFFEKYATAGKVGGTGLGTYSAAIMTRALGGTITMETADDVGTTVCIVIPSS